jgi:hypothetical protein
MTGTSVLTHRTSKTEVPGIVAITAPQQILNIEHSNLTEIAICGPELLSES